jgi:hypothetical protein
VIKTLAAGVVLLMLGVSLLPLGVLMQQEVTASFSGEGTGTGKIFVSTGSAAYNIAGQFDRARRFFTFAIAEIGLAVGIIVFASIGSVVQGLTSSIRTLLLYVLP